MCLTNLIFLVDKKPIIGYENTDNINENFTSSENEAYMFEAFEEPDEVTKTIKSIKLRCNCKEKENCVTKYVSLLEKDREHIFKNFCKIL